MADVKEKKYLVDYGNPATGKFRLNDYPFYLISQIDHRYGVEMENVLRRHKMERVQWHILLILREKNPSSISEISERSGRKLSTLSRVIERMRIDELVSTAPRQSDMRSTDVFLNEAGVQALHKILKVASKQYEHVMDGFSAAEIEALRNHLKNILTRLHRSPYE